MQTIQEMALQRSVAKAGEIVALGQARGMSAAAMFEAFAGMIAGQNPRMARLTLDALEATIAAKPVADDHGRPVPPHGSGPALLMESA